MLLVFSRNAGTQLFQGFFKIIGIKMAVAHGRLDAFVSQDACDLESVDLLIREKARGGVSQGDRGLPESE